MGSASLIVLILAAVFFSAGGILTSKLVLKASKNQTKTAQLMRCGFNVVNRIMHLSVKAVNTPSGTPSDSLARACLERIGVIGSGASGVQVSSRFSQTC